MMDDNRDRVQRVTDVMDPARLAALSAALGRDDTPSTLPPFAHHLYFWRPEPPAKLGRDGHPALGSFIPATGLPRRMWAGGRLKFHAPVVTGVPAERELSVINHTRKDGRSGPMAIVTLEHAIHQSGTLCRTEEQDLVFLNDRSPDDPLPPARPAPDGAEISREYNFDTTLLFRYSALTFNGHRIHYDIDYCKSVEGYPGLVVHGPLLAHLLMDMAAEALGDLSSFSFRATAPLFNFQRARLCAKSSKQGLTLWVENEVGAQNMIAEAG